MQHGNTSEERQLKSTKEVCEHFGYELDEEKTFEDLAVSAKDGKNWMDVGTVQKLKDEGKEDKVSALANFYLGTMSGEIETPCALIIDSADRFSRGGGLKGIANLAMLVNAGVTLVTAVGKLRIQPLGDDATEAEYKEQEMSLMMFLMELNNAHSYIRELGRKVSDGYSLLREGNKGAEIKKLSVPSLPWWINKVDLPNEVIKGRGDKKCRKQMVLIPEKVELVRYIYKLALKHSILDITYKLVDEGYNISQSQVQYALQSHAPYGRYEMKERKGRRHHPPIDDHYPAIMEQKEWQKTRDALESRKFKHKGRRSKVPSYWKNILKFLDGTSCFVDSMQRYLADGTLKKYPKISCKVRKKLIFRLDKEKVDNLILDLAESLEPKDFSSKKAQEAMDEWQREQAAFADELEKVRKRINEVEDSFIDDYYDKSQLNDAKGILRKLNQKERELIAQSEEHRLTKPESFDAKKSLTEYKNMKDGLVKFKRARTFFDKIYLGRVKDIGTYEMEVNVPEKIVDLLSDFDDDQVFVIGELKNGTNCIRLLDNVVFARWKRATKIPS